MREGRTLRVPWGTWEAVLAFLAMPLLPVVVYLLVLALGSFSPTFEGLAGALESENVKALAAFSVLDAAIMIGLIYLFLRSRNAGWKDLGLRSFSVGQALLYLIVTLVVFFLLAGIAITLVDLLVPSFDAEQPQTNEFTESISEHPHLAMLALVLLPPVIEELVFRGFIFPGLATRMGYVWAAVLSSALFAIAHLQANVGVYTFLLGLILCWLYIKFRSIIPGIALHMANNLMAYLALGATAGIQ